MNNIFQFIQSIKNPNAFIQGIMSNSQYNNNPMMQNAFKMSQKGDIQGLQNMAQNLAKERGMSLDDLRKSLGI